MILNSVIINRFFSDLLKTRNKMVLDANILREKLIEAWKLRSNETSFSASLAPLIAECQLMIVHDQMSMNKYF